MGSYGGFVTAIQLIKAMSNSRGASAEYQAVLRELADLTEILKTAQGVVKSIRIGDERLVHAVNSAAEKSLQTMRAFELKVEGYQNVVRSRSTIGKWKEMWWRIGWGLFKREELSEVRKHLEPNKSSLQLRIATLQLSQSSSSSKEIIEALRLLSTDGNAIKISLSELLGYFRREPRRLGHTWESDGEQLVKLTDPFDREIVLPMELCHTMKSLSDFMKFRFQRLPASSLVQAGYFGFSNSRGECPNSENWLEKMGRDWRIQMSVTVFKLGRRWNSCPQCTSVGSSRQREGGMRCSNCHTWFDTFMMSLHRDVQEFHCCVERVGHLTEDIAIQDHSAWEHALGLATGSDTTDANGAISGCTSSETAPFDILADNDGSEIDEEILDLIELVHEVRFLRRFRVWRFHGRNSMNAWTLFNHRTSDRFKFAKMTNSGAAVHALWSVKHDLATSDVRFVGLHASAAGIA